MNKSAFYHDEKCFWHSNAGSFSLVVPVGGWVQPPASDGFAESPESKRRALSLLQVSSLANKMDFKSAPMVTEKNMQLVHTQAYLEKFKELSDNGGGEAGEYAPFGQGSYEIARLSTGLAVQAIDDVISGKYANAYVMSRPPGHHCLPDMALGFCLLANISIAIEAAFAKHKDLHRVVVLDWDVHHGNGTQAIFNERDDVLTISLHQENCFPPGVGTSAVTDNGSGIGTGYNINVPLLPGGGHEAYLYAMEKIVLPAIENFKPDLIVVASGLDANGVDPLARMLAHSGTYRELTRQVKGLADKYCNGRLVAVHEGGYSETYVPFCVHAVLEALIGEDSNVEDPLLDLIVAQQPTERFNQLQKQLIDEMCASYFT
tara:strand:- start:2156 stop:3277 length:1122 start_codon:yes stop_codon:yes gene_type:complete